MHICFVALLRIAHYILSFKSEKVIIVVSKKDHALWHPYQTCAKTKIMSDIEQVHEQMNGDMETMKEQMTMMMEAMMSMRTMMEVNVVAVVPASTVAERDPSHLPSFDQEIHLVSHEGG